MACNLVYNQNIASFDTSSYEGMSQYLANQLVMIVPEKDYSHTASWSYNANMVPEVLIQI